MSRRIGRWMYGAHPELNPGWRLSGTNLVLDFDPLDTSGSLRGAYVLWRDGRPEAPIDHYLDAAMRFVEKLPECGCVDGECRAAGSAGCYFGTAR